MRINYIVRKLAINDLRMRVFLPAMGEELLPNFIEYDPDTLRQVDDQVYALVTSSGGEPNALFISMGSDQAYPGDMLPELGLRFLDGRWYLCVGQVL